MIPKGHLFTSNPAGLKKVDFNADILLITRAGPELENVEIMRDLAPSSELFQRFVNNWKDSGNFDWWPQYEEKFKIEMKSNIKLQALRDVYKRLYKGKNVILVCFCKDHRYCHRRLVGDFFEEYGIHATELNPITIEQITLF